MAYSQITSHAHTVGMYINIHIYDIYTYLYTYMKFEAIGVSIEA